MPRAIPATPSPRWSVTCGPASWRCSRRRGPRAARARRGRTPPERGCSAATRNQRLAVIKSFCRYTAVEQPDHLHQVTQVLAIRQKKTPAPQLGYLTADEVKTLLAEPARPARAVRDTVLLALAYDTAPRVQELCDLDVADIRRSKPMTVTIRGKGSKIRYVPMMDPTAQLVADYLHHRDRHPGLGADADPLFHGPNHSRLTRSGVAKLVARHVRAVRARDPGWAPGLPVTPHTLRRSRAMQLIQAGVNLIYIRDLLGHADVSTTEIYAREVSGIASDGRCLPGSAAMQAV
jgi:integrase/recombinase XerD